MLTEDTLAPPIQDGRTTAVDNGNQGLSFAELLDDYEPLALKHGEYVKGEVLQIDKNVILADVDAKRTAVVPPHEILKINEADLAKLSVGDEVTLYVLRTPVGGDDLLVSLTKGFEQQDWIDAQTHLANEEPLELEVTGYNKGGLMVAFGHLSGFVPASHVAQLQHVHDQRALASRKAELVGEELLLKVIEVDSERQRLVLSAKKAQKELRQQRLLELKLMEGETIVGRITNLISFGAFVDLDGVEGLVHISEIAWQRVENPSDMLTLGEEIEVLIQSVDVDRERVSLSRKSLLPSPWDLFAETHAPGELLEGVVTNVAEFGAFVLVEEDIEGLVHISELNGSQDFAAQDILSAGDSVLVRILEIQPDRQRLGLSQRRVSQDEEIAWIWQRQQPSEDLLEDEEE